MTLLGQIDPLDFASLKPASTSIAELNAQQAQQQATRVQAQVNQLQLFKEQEERQRTAAFRTELAAANTAPSVESLSAVARSYPEFAQGLQSSIKQLDATGKQQLADQALEPWLAGVNGRPDLLKTKLVELAGGFESKGMKDKADGVRKMVAEVDTNLDIVTGKLGLTVLEAVGPEKFKELVAAQGLDTKRRTEKAAMTLAESKVTSRMLTAQEDEAVAKALKEGRAAEVEGIKAEFARRRETQDLATGAAQEGSALASAAEQRSQTAERADLAELKKRGLSAEVTTKEAGAAEEAKKLELARQQAEVNLEKATREEAMAKGLARPQAEANLAKAQAETRQIEAETYLKPWNMELREREVRVREDAERRERMTVQREASKISDTVKTSVNKDVGEARAASTLAREAEDLIKKTNKYIVTHGALGWGLDIVKSITGQQGNESSVRKALARFTMKDVLTQIPPGALSEAEQKTIREGVPAKFESSKVWVDYLETVKKASQLLAGTKDVEATWKTLNEGLLTPASKAFEIRGVQVQPGESLEDAKLRILDVKKPTAGAAPQYDPAEVAAEIARRKTAKGGK